MMRVRDLTGQRFGKLTVLGRSGSDGDGARWLCKCDCGNYTTVARRHLVSGAIKSCGCLKGRRPMDLAGMRFGRLVAIEICGKYESSGGMIWRCRCDCGTETYVCASRLINGGTRSCGCLKSSKVRAAFLAEEKAKDVLHMQTLRAAVQ